MIVQAPPRRSTGALLVATAILLALVGAWTPSPRARAATTSYAPPGAPKPQPPPQCGSADPTWFQPNCAYAGYFGDPSVIRVDSDPNLGSRTTYYAFGTSAGGSTLPVMWATDPVNGPWVARPAYAAPTPNGDPYFNDGLAAPYTRGGNQPPPWVIGNGSTGPWQQKTLWAPGAVALPNGGYAAYFAGEDRPQHWCIGRAVAANPWGPYTADAAPLLCGAPDSSPQGIIDPQPFRAPNGTLYLLYKTQGVPGVGPSKIYTRPLAGDGTPAPGAGDGFLLQTDATWQLTNPSTGAGSIENPAMTYAGGHYYLFYSGNEWTSADYGIGYAVCNSPTGPCVDQTTAAPWLRDGADSGGPYWGAGGATPFTDAAGDLILAFHAWDRPGAQTAGGRRLFHTLRVYVEPYGAIGTGDPVTNARYVAAAYRDFFGRAPSGDESLFWTSALGTGTSRYGFVSSLAASPAWVSHIVDQLYLNTLGRAPDAQGRAYWIDAVASGRVTVAQAAASFYSSLEYFDGIGGATLASWVTDLYHKLLGRSPDSGGLAYWTSVAASQGLAAVAYPFFQSPESARVRVTQLYLTLLGRRPDSTGLTYWAGVVVSQGDLSLAAQLATSDEYYQRAQTG